MGRAFVAFQATLRWKKGGLRCDKKLLVKCNQWREEPAADL